MKFTVDDVRFPTSKDLTGSDAIHTDPDYSATYVTVYTSDNNLILPYDRIYFDIKISPKYNISLTSYMYMYGFSLFNPTTQLESNITIHLFKLNGHINFDNYVEFKNLEILYPEYTYIKLYRTQANNNVFYYLGLTNDGIFIDTISKNLFILFVKCK